MDAVKQDSLHEKLYLSVPAKAHSPSLEVCLAKNASEVLEAQKLRFSIFSEEYGAQLGSNGIDHDVFDAYCDHLLVFNSVHEEFCF